jgi:hypothetical protein
MSSSPALLTLVKSHGTLNAYQLHGQPTDRLSLVVSQTIKFVSGLSRLEDSCWQELRLAVARVIIRLFCSGNTKNCIYIRILLS